VLVNSLIYFFIGAALPIKEGKISSIPSRYSLALAGTARQGNSLSDTPARLELELYGQEGYFL